MDVDEGFILGIYNYCDRWCETCRFTSRCRLFADGAKHNAITTPELKTLSETPPHPSDVRDAPGWLEELLDGINTEAPDPLPRPPALPANFRRLVALSEAYRDHAWAALEAIDVKGARPNEAISIILWFAPLIASKARRALHGLNEFDGDREFPPDHEGSAKVALLGIDRSMLAWADARRLGLVSVEQAARFIGELHWLCGELENIIPLARAFVRPGFDEPDEVGSLEESDWS
jgi:hypothetical protein